MAKTKRKTASLAWWTKYTAAPKKKKKKRKLGAIGYTVGPIYGKN